MSFHRLADAHGQAAAEKLLLQQVVSSGCLLGPLSPLTYSATASRVTWYWVSLHLSPFPLSGCVSPLSLQLRAEAEGQTCRAKELQRLLSTRDAEVSALRASPYR